MNCNIFQISIVVDDYDKAIAFYTEKLNFDLIEDTVLSPVKRWVRVKPKGLTNFALLLAKAKNEEEHSRIGNQTGGRVFLFMHTDDLDRDHKNLLANNIKIVREPTVEEFGKVLVFADCFGNLWDLIQPNKKQ